MKILIECFHGIGDFVCALPMIKSLRDRYSEAKFTVLVKFDINAQLLSLSKIHVDQVIVWDVYKSGLKRNFKLVYSLRKEHYDFFVSSFQTPIKKAKLLAFLIKANKNLGCQFKNDIILNKLSKSTHFVDGNLLGISEICNNKLIDTVPHLYPNLELQLKVKSQLEKFNSKQIIGLCIGEGNYFLKNRLTRSGKFFAKGWGIDKFNCLIKQLLENKYGVILIGGKQEIPLLNGIDKCFLSNKNLLNCVGKVDISTSVAISSLCDLVVGVDTGMIHIAAAVGSKTLSIFGPTSSFCCGAKSLNSHFSDGKSFCTYAPCFGTKHFSLCNDRKCLKYQSVDLIYNRIELLLNC